MIGPKMRDECCIERVSLDAEKMRIIQSKTGIHLPIASQRLRTPHGNCVIARNQRFCAAKDLLKRGLFGTQTRMLKLGVNIDHVATVREARYRGRVEGEPDPVLAALACEAV